VSITLISALGGSLQGVSRRSPGRSRPRELGRSGLHVSSTRERASQRGEYENFLIPQTPSASPLATQQGVSGGDENANTYYVPTAQLTLAQTRGVEGQAPG